MDKIIPKLAALGVPGLVLIIAIEATGLSGAAALTTALAALGPFGMKGGIATLGAIGILVDAISEYGLEAIFEGVIKELFKQGESKRSIKEKIEKYPLSKELKVKLHEKLDAI